MNGNELVPVFSDSEDNSDVKIVPHKKRRKNKGKRILAWFLIFALIGVGIYAYYYNSEAINGFFGFAFKNNQGDNHPEDNKGGNNDDGKDNNGNNPPASVDNDGDDGNTGKLSSFLINEQNMGENSLINQTDYRIDLSSLKRDIIKAGDVANEYGKDAPVVLIIHTHGNECYSDGQKYSKNSAFYSSEKNARDIGKIIADKLNESGINTLHIDTIFGESLLYSSQEEYAKCLNETLNRYPSISYIFDISRDIIINDDMSMTKPVCTIDSKKYAQIQITVGTDKLSDNDNWKNNLYNAVSVSNLISAGYENLMRPTVISNFSFNQNIGKCSLRVDIGAFSNTFEEASETAVLFASAISEYLNN